jgi:hypothetical protein
MSPKKRSGRSPGNPAGKPPKSGQVPGGILTQAGEDMLVAAVDMVGRTGSEFCQVRYDDHEQPVVWMAVGKWGDTHEVGAGMNPIRAVIRLLESVVDGGTCQYCGKPTSITEDYDSMPLDKLVCWYQYDPELKKFRRGCEGTA